MKDYERILDDICLCASVECPKHKECLRGIGYEKVKGIHTISYLLEVCDKNNYEMFIGEKE